MRVEGKPELVYKATTAWFVIHDATKRVGQLIYWSLQIRMRVSKKRKLLVAVDFHFILESNLVSLDAK